MNFETVQIVIIAALSISTILITIIAIQIILLIKEIRALLRRASAVARGAEAFVSHIGNSFAQVDNITQGAKFIFSLFNKFTGKKKRHHEDE